MVKTMSEQWKYYYSSPMHVNALKTMALHLDLSHSDSVPDILQVTLPSQLLQKIDSGT